MTPVSSSVYETFAAQIDAPVAAYFSSCVHCGICAEACLFYTETNDPKYTPIYKTEVLRKVWKNEYTFWGKLFSSLGLSAKITEEELADWEELVYDSCTMCGRCSLICPVGNDIVYMIRKTREGFVASGHAPEDLKSATVRAVEIGSPMGVKFPALQAQLAHVEKATGIKVPVDKKDADYMLLLSSMEIMNFPEFIESVAKIFSHAGLSWTISSTAYEATNSGIQIGSKDIAGELVQRIVDAAEALNVKTVISPECGHAYTAIRWEGPNLVGRAYSFDVIHILELLEGLRLDGRLKMKGKNEDCLTFHDPCQLVRRGGVVQEPRNLLHSVSRKFYEMDDAGTLNWCCGAGGGVSANQRAHPLKIKAFNRKKKQLDKLGVDKMVTACANCRINLEEGLEENNMEMDVIGLTELIAEYLDTSGSGQE